MHKFRFKFDAVLKVRKIRENDALMAFGRAQKEYQERLQDKQNLLNQLAKTLEGRENLGRESVSPSAFQVMDNFIIGTKQNIVRCDQAIFRANKKLEKTMREYLFSKRQTRAIEILYDKAFAEYRKEYKKKELKDQSELTILRRRLREDVNQ